MTLQIALLLIGIVIVVVVAFTAFDRNRQQGALRRRPDGGIENPRERVAPTIADESATYPSAADGAALPSTPARTLRADASVTLSKPEPARRAQEEIMLLEDVASMPLDLDHGIKRLRSAQARVTAHIDEHIEFVMYLSGGAPVARDVALGPYKQEEYRLDKPHRLLGRVADGQGWTELAADPSRTLYRDLALTMMLVDTHGAASESDLNALAQAGLKLADALSRQTRFSLEFDEALRRAHQLHQFCEAFDVIAAVNVGAVDADGLRGQLIERAATRLGFEFSPQRVFQMKSVAAAGGRELFTLASLVEPGVFDPAAWDRLTTPGVTMFMSVPLVPHPAAVFDKMADAAIALAEQVGGRLLDQDQRPLNDQGIAVIRRQIEEIGEKMLAFGVEPGSESAQRLFAPAVAAARGAGAPA
ncbi:MAG: cell division protein ZipA C-terminal FtsZ-binding domain-containing protein [Pseudomonadota bacterium]